MRYSNLKFCGKNRQTLGDQMQLIAIDEIYRQMGYNTEKDIVYIDKNDLANYDGEEVVLPISLALVDYVEHGWAGRFSPKIKPVFLGLSMARGFLYPEEVEFFKRFGPIGCRDERTYLTMRKYQIPSYLGGCITCTFPRRKKDPEMGKIFLVDVPDTLVIENKGLKDHSVVRMSHFVEGGGNPKKEAEELLHRYRDEASLVVTSLLHCASPCMAMGIPVILVKSLVSYRFGWIDKLLPIHRPENPLMLECIESTNLQGVDRLMRLIAMKRLQTPYEKFPELAEISDFWLRRKRTSEYALDCFIHYKTFLDRYFAAGGREYCLWGLTQMSEMIVEYVRQTYPQGVLAAVYDKYRAVNFFGVMSSRPTRVSRFKGCVLVTTMAASADALEMCRDGLISREQICLMEIYK